MTHFNFLTSWGTSPENGPTMDRHYIEIDTAMSRKIFTILFVLFLSIGQMWGADEVYKTALFGSSYNSSNQDYTSSFDATNGTFVVTATNFNNNKNGWTNSSGLGQIKCGRKNNTSVGTITTKAAIDDAITKVVVTVDAFTSGKVNSFKLYVASNSTFTQNLQTITATITTGANTFTVTTPTASRYYKVEIDCASGSSNGLVTISKVEYYHSASSGCSNTPSMSFSPDAVEKTVGDDNFTKTVTISGKGGSQTVAYSSSNTAVATVNSSTGEVTIKTNGSTTITASVAESGDYCSASASYTLTVNKPSYTINWYVGGAQVKTESVTKDEKATLPSTPADNALGGSCSSLVFRGWSETNIGSTGTTAPADLFTAAPTITSAKNYYAVFAEEENNYINYDKTETFENQTAGTTYNSTQSYTTNNSNAQVAWSMYYGTVSTNAALTGSKSAQMRWYSSAKTNYPYIKTTSAIQGLQKITFNALVGNTNVKMAVWYSTDGSNWTSLASNQTVATSKDSYNYSINGTVGTNYYIKIGVDGTNSTAPSSGNYTFLIDDVKFDYKTGGSSYSNFVTSCCTELGTIGGSVNVTNQRSLTLQWNKLSGVDGTTPYTITCKQGSTDAGTIGDVDLSGVKATCTVTGLDCGTTYTFTITAHGDATHCDKTQENIQGTTSAAMTLPTLSYTTPLNAGGSNVNPSWASAVSHDGSVTYTSSNSSVLQIINASTGEAKPVGAGTATITATYAQSANNCEASKTSNTITVNGNVSVTFNANGGGGSMDNQSIPVSTATALTANAFTTPSSCKYFYGWATSQANADAGTRAYTDGQSVTITEGLNLYAIWKSYNYTVTKGTGTGAATFSLSASNVDCGGSITVTATPDATHKGSPIVSISPSNKGTVTGTTISNITGNITVDVEFVAKASYAITWKVKGVALTGDALTGVTTSVLEGNGITNLPSVANSALNMCITEGCTFKGWSESEIKEEGQNAPADLFSDAAHAPSINGAKTFHAVFAKQIAGEEEEDQTPYSYTIEEKKWSTTGAQTLSGKSWTLAHSDLSDPYYAYDGTKGQQVGKGASPATTMSLSTSAISGKIKAVKISTSGASSVAATVGVSVGGTAFKNGNNTTVSITASNTEYTFTGSASGTITITWNQTSSKALYFKAISVEYATVTPTVTYQDYMTGCCEALADINGEVSWSNPTTAVLTWDNVTHVSSWAVKYKKHADANYSDFAGSITGTENKTCTISSLVCGTDYDFQIIATADDGYCDKSQTIIDTQAHKYAITLDPANGEVTGGSFLATDKACDGDDVDLLAEAATGYAFSSWTITKASSGTIDPAANIAETIFEMPAEAVTVSAAFSIINYTITYENMTGATNPISNPATYTINSPAITLGAPTKDGFDFGGWFTNSDLAAGHEAGTPAITAGSTGNKTFYAKWTQTGTHTVTISDYSNGTVSVTYEGMGTALTSGSRTIAENTVLTITATPSTGYEGLLTVNDDDFTSGNTHTLTADITIEALFEPKTYTITYKDQGNVAYSGSNLASLPTSHTYNTATALVNGVKAGYSFGGWFTDADCTESAGSSLGATAYTENITLYAKWEEVTMYSVTWMVNGASYSAGTPTTSVEAGDAISNLPTAPEVCDEDLTFMGWTNAAIEGTQVAAPAVLFTTAGAAPAVTGNVTFYAVFAKEEESTATFNATSTTGLTKGSGLVWTHDASGIVLTITAGSYYTGSPKTFTVTADSNCGLTTPDGVTIKGAILTVSGASYAAKSVYPGTLETSGTTQTITSVNAEYLHIYATKTAQIRITNIDVKYTPVSPTYSNYRTSYEASVPTPTLDVASGKYTSDQLVTIDNYDGKYMYFYTTNGSTPAADANLDAISPAVAYDSNDGIEITETSTVKVIAYDLCHNASEVTTATYTIAESLTLAEFVEQKPTTNEKVDFTGAIVMAREDKRLYVQKDAAAMCLYYEAGAPSFAVGKQIANGIVTGHYDADDLEMKVSNAGSPTATADGVLPTPLVITDDNASTLMVEANMYRYAQMNSVTLDYDNDSYLNAYSTTSDKHYYYDDWFEVLTSKTLPLTTTVCSVKGIITPYYDDVYFFDQLSPILANDISTNATAVLPTISDLGGADAAHAVEVAEGKEITITENADFDAIYQINDGDETAINTSAVVTITNTSVATKVYVKASRDYYADNAITYYYIANSALTEHTITCATGLAGGSIGADKSAAVTGATVTLTPTPAEHYSLTSWTVTYNDGEEKTINVVNNQFTMPGYAVNVTATFAEDAFATVSFAKGDEAVTGDVPASQKVYVGHDVTLPANPFTFAGHNFAGWKYNETTKQPSETYEVTASGNITFTAQWTANPICTVTLHANGADDIVTEVLQGATYNIPNAGTIVGYTFLGWATVAQNSEVTEAIDVVSSFTPEVLAVASTKEFYAVYTRQEGTTQYEKVTSAPADWSGQYLIVNEDDAKAWKGSTNDDNGAIDVTITNHTIAASATVDAERFTIATMTGGYSIKGTTGGKYIYGTSGSNGTNYGTSAALNTISISSGNVTITSNTSVLRQNNSNANLFRYYRSSSYSDQHPIQLYKYIEAITYYTTNPTVKYNVSYELGEGAWRANEGCDASVVEAGTVYNEVCEYEPVLANKAFDKWQVNDADIELPYTINANTTFTAVYRDAVQYAVNYDANGGVGNAPAATNVQEAANYTVLANSWFFRSGHTFTGWNTAANGSGVAYAAEAVMAMPSANVTLYAQWQELPANNKDVVIVAKVGNNYYAMGQTLSTKQFNAIAVAGVRDNKVILPDGFSDENKTAITWHMITNNNGATAAFYSPANNKYLAGGNDLSLSNDPVDWTWNDETQCYVISGRTFMYRSSYDFRSYSTSNIGTSGYAEAMYVTTEFAKQITDDDATEADLSLGDNIIVKDGAELTIGSQRFINDVVVENGGELTLNANLSVHDLIIHSTLGKGTGTTTSGNAPGNSGQIANGSNLTVNGDVYLELELTQDAAASAGWYAFSVPFPVDAINGVYYGDTKLQNEVGYAIMSHYGDLRAKNEYAWKKFRGIMQPGVFYVITVGNTDYKTLRFKKVAGEALVASTSVPVSPFPSETGNNKDGAWNGIGNPNLQISNLATSFSAPMQFYDHKTNSFNNRLHSMNLVVGSAFFIQYDATSTVSIPAGTTSHEGYLAPKRERNAVNETIYQVELTNVATGEMEDNLFLTAREDATSEYEIGRDMAKMSMGTAKCAQMYVPAYGTKLCAADFRLINDKATYPLTLTAPQAGTYSISVVDNDAATIYLTKDGRMIWNLSMSPCEIELPQGTTEGYGLKLIVNAPAVVTGVDEVTGDGLQVTGAQKVIIDEHVYILRGEQLYGIDGKIVK